MYWTRIRYCGMSCGPTRTRILPKIGSLMKRKMCIRDRNTGQGKNVPVSIIVDELPTLYFHKIDRLIGTAPVSYTHLWKLFWQVKTDVMIKGEDLFRTGIVLGVKLPVK